MKLHRLFFYLTVLLLPTQLGKHFFPDWALVLGRRLDYLSPTIFLTDITIMLTLASWFFSSFSSFKIKNYWKFVAFVGFVVLNIFFAASPLVALYKWSKVFEFVVFGFYIVKTKPSFSRSLWCLSFAVFYSSIIAIAQFFLQHSVGGLLWFLGERTFDITTLGIARIQLLLPSVFRLPSSEYLRAYATFPHPNVLGGFLTVTLPLIIYKSANDKSTNKKIKIFRWTTIFLGFVALVFTFSRSAWVAFVLLFIVLKIKNMPREQVGLKFIENFKLKIKNYLPLAGITLCLFFAIPYLKTLTMDNESVFVRNELNSAAMNMILPNFRFPSSAFRHLLFGVGLGNFLVELPKYYPHREIFFLQPVHNIYLLLLSETGIVGFLFCAYFLWKLYKHIARQRLFVICHLSFVILLLLGAVDHYPLTLQQGQLLLTFLISFFAIHSLGEGW